MNEEVFSKALNSAFRSLARRAHSKQEIETKLGNKDFPADIVAQVIAKLEKLEYLNDDLFAQRWATFKATGSLWSDIRIECALLRKGVDKAVIKQALTHARLEVSEEVAIGSVLNKKLKGRNLGDINNTEKLKIARLLITRGFTYSTIQKVLMIRG
ncbi:MAG: RecX family transcriptional regulator [Deltaproteobacteria bacterium]